MAAKRWLVRLIGQQMQDVGAEPVCGACGRRLGHRTLKQAKQCLGQSLFPSEIVRLEDVFTLRPLSQDEVNAFNLESG
ncbi:MAG: hypothetical protein OXI92_03985 [Acidobacteriota bacterium]|nr:hypothetical protein [Acidobacteriota bacterium]